MNRRSIFAAIAFGTLASVGWADSGDLLLSDLAKIVEVSDPQVSPDGRSIVFVVARPNPAGSGYDQALVLVEIPSGMQRTLTFGRTGVSSPRWSPSGDRVAFLDSAVPVPEGDAAAGVAADSTRRAASVEKARDQIFVMPMNGGDPYRITNAPRDIEQFVWSPDGTQIAYVSADDERGRGSELHVNAFAVADNSFLETEAPTSCHLWIVPAAGGTPRRLTSGFWSLPRGTPPSWPGSPLSWSPDGASIAIVRQATPNWADYEQSVIEVVDVATGRERKLTSHRAYEGFPVYSPNGSSIAYWYPRDGDPNNENELFVTGYLGGDGVDVTRALDRDIVRGVWAADGKSLLVAAHDGTRVSIWLQPIEGRARKLDLGDVSPAWEFWVDMSLATDGGIAFAGYTANRPSEIYYLPAGGGPVRRLTSYNAEIESHAHAKVDRFSWKGPDGFQEDGVLVSPTQLTPGTRYPLVLLIHGGPQAASTLSFTPLAQLLAARGYVVFEPNYRGSDNNGNAYQRAVYQDSGAGPARDIIAGIHALEAKGFVDPARIAVSGWSYGGYMTTWLIGHYHFWRAAVAGAAITDFVEQYVLSDNGPATSYSLGGPPWSEKMLNLYRAQSPITYARQINTPTLILSNTADTRVPITQSYLLYHALKDNGVPVQFLAYPKHGHSPGDPIHQADAYRRWIAWIDDHMPQAAPHVDSSPSTKQSDEHGTTTR